MQSSPHFAARPFRATTAAARSPGSEGGTDAANSVAWKGWTNGEGDRVSTAAQFSRVAAPTAFSAASAPGAVPLMANRMSAPVAPAAPLPPAMPVPESAAAFGPVNAAIERMLVRNQDELAVTVRFEQGGSLSLKLAMRDGAIATHFQTNVAGLEEALRTGWNSFAQDWNLRGVKLASPTFAGGDSPSSDDAAGRHGQSFSEHEQAGSSSDSAGSLFSTRRRFSRGGGRESGVASANPTPVGPLSPGLDRHGIRTWA